MVGQVSHVAVSLGLILPLPLSRFKDFDDYGEPATWIIQERLLAPAQQPDPICYRDSSLSCNLTDAWAPGIRARTFWGAILSQVEWRRTVASSYTGTPFWDRSTVKFISLKF